MTPSIMTCVQVRSRLLVGATPLRLPPSAQLSPASNWVQLPTGLFGAQWGGDEMKLKGKKIEPEIQTMVLPRQNGHLVFRAQPILDYEPFDKICPPPKPPVRMLPGGIESVNTEDPQYDKDLDEWSTHKWEWMMLKSLGATEGLEWDTVDMANPATYSNYTSEMSKAGISPNEIASLQALVTDACGLNQRKIEQATKAFLAGQGQEQSEKSSPVTEQNSTPSGEPVSATA